MKSLLTSIFLFQILSSISASQNGAETSIETKYYLELPETFLNAIEKDHNDQPILWHPSLEMKKIYSHEKKQDIPVLNQRANSNFLSLVQVSQDQGTNNLVYVPGSEANATALQSTSLNCKCHFVKDPNGIYLFQQTATTQIIEQPQETTTNATENTETKQLNTISVNTNMGNKESAGSDIMRNLIPNTEEASQNTFNVSSNNKNEDTIQNLMEKNQLLNLQLENQQLREELGKGQKQQQLLKLVEMLKSSGTSGFGSEDFKMNRLYESSNQFQNFLEENRRKNQENFESMLLLNMIQNKQKEDRQNFKDKLMFLLDDSLNFGQNNFMQDNDDLENFYRFNQRYNKYKSLISLQSSNKKRGFFDNSNYNHELEDYNLLLALKSIKDKSLQNNFIQALLNE